MGRRNRSAALSRQHLHRRRQAVGGVRLGRQRDQDRQRGVRRGPQERPLRRDQRQSDDRTPRSRYSELAARRIRPQKSRRLSDRARRRPDLRRRLGACAARRACAPGRSSGSRPSTAPQRRFICRGCYFVYEEANGLPQHSIRPGTPFADIPANWRCPDCGTEKTTFRPYVEKAATG